MCIFLHENRLGIKETNISFLTCYARTLAQKFREPYHSNHVIPPRGYRVDTIFIRKITKGNNSAKNVGGVTVVHLCTSSGHALYFYQVL